MSQGEKSLGKRGSFIQDALKNPQSPREPPRKSASPASEARVVERRVRPERPRGRTAVGQRATGCGSFSAPVGRGYLQPAKGHRGPISRLKPLSSFALRCPSVLEVQRERQSVRLSVHLSVCLSVRVCVCVCPCICVWWCVRAREREREREQPLQKISTTIISN